MGFLSSVAKGIGSTGGGLLGSFGKTVGGALGSSLFGTPGTGVPKWRKIVKEAQAAGIHPLYAGGGPVSSPASKVTPIGGQADFGGQRSPHAALQAELLQAQIDNTKADSELARARAAALAAEQKNDTTEDMESNLAPVPFPISNMETKRVRKPYRSPSQKKYAHYRFMPPAGTEVWSHGNLQRINEGSSPVRIYEDELGEAAALIESGTRVPDLFPIIYSSRSSTQRRIDRKRNRKKRRWQRGGRG
jgi:hypothetical protein